MRYNEFGSGGWRHYSGQERACVLTPLPEGSASGSSEAHVQWGSVTTGKQRVWVAFFIQVIQRDGKEWLVEHPHSLRAALRLVEADLNADGWSLGVIGLDPEWRESGLSANSGYGYHPDFSEAAHMLQPK